MITPEQDEGIEFWGDFYIKPYKLNFMGGPAGQEKYIKCDFMLIKTQKTDPIILHAYTFWQVSELSKKYQENDRTRLFNTHKARLPKDEVVYLECVLKSTLPSDFTGTTIEAAAHRVEADKGRDALDKSFDNIVYINNVYTKTNSNDIINQQFTKIAKEMNSKLDIYLKLKSKMDSEMEQISNSESTTVVNDASTSKNGGKETLLV